MPPILTTKSRFRDSGLIQTLSARSRFKTNNGTPWSDWVPETAFARTWGMYETLTSVGHKGPPYKEGGPFSLKRYSQQMSVNPISWSYSGQTVGEAQYEVSGTMQSYGYFVAQGFPTSISETTCKTGHDAISFPVSSLISYGATGVNRFKPLKSAANLGQFIGELREGLPRIPLTLFARLKNFRSLGSEYLNAEFGWKPFLKDLQEFYQLQQSLNSKMAQIIRDNGRPIRRNGDILFSRSNTNPAAQSDGTLGIFPGASFLGSAVSKYPSYSTLSPKRFTQTESGTRIWFAGRFRYYIPDVTDDRWTRQARNALYGANPTPSMLYELLPWSWLIDWFSNVGDVISNASDNGIADLIIDYAYTMRHVYTKRVDSVWCSPWYCGPGGAPVSKWTSVHGPQLHTFTVLSETKERIAATPFGFGLQIDDLSARQFAILTALGLSRVNF